MTGIDGKILLSGGGGSYWPTTTKLEYLDADRIELEYSYWATITLTKIVGLKRIILEYIEVGANTLKSCFTYIKTFFFFF